MLHNSAKKSKKNKEIIVGDDTMYAFLKKSLSGNRDVLMLGVNDFLFFLVHHFGGIICALNPWLAQVLLVHHVQDIPNQGNYAIWNYSVCLFVKAWCQFVH